MIGRAASLVGVVLLGATSCGGERELVGYTREPAPRVDTVALPDLSRGGAPFNLRAEPGHLLVVYFGYTNCPDICPTTLADLARAREQLGDDAARVDVAMVTVDPERDTDVLVRYVQDFIADARALATPDAAALRSVADPFGVTYDVRTAPGGRVEVGHSSYLFGVDDSGTLVVTWPFGTSADELAADLGDLLPSG